MVISGKVSKINAKIPVSKVDHGKKNCDVDLQVPVSPSSSESLEDEVIALRARNKVLLEALKGVNESATALKKKHFDLVWFARNRYRYPNHGASKRIQESEEHREDLDLLKSDDGDYHHGFQAGVLAASRMFQEQSDILHVNDQDEEEKLMANSIKHREKVEESKTKFERRRSLPQVEAGEFPEN
ncbi:expressed unknown protein [Seminavis robusta]|uniref:Uncharacterized protein n=1 Tax=Seminavis robusta TaxID=568900 RepID=A0A9N8EWL8_9STRA|nr:expressed unknown protein [Seminavis robusta]|eukprot:Sro2045_g312440.1 n/a (185) ;mRNA; f:9058-9880